MKDLHSTLNELHNLHQDCNILFDFKTKQVVLITSTGERMEVQEVKGATHTKLKRLEALITQW